MQFWIQQNQIHIHLNKAHYLQSICICLNISNRSYNWIAICKSIIIVHLPWQFYYQLPFVWSMLRWTFHFINSSTNLATKSNSKAFWTEFEWIEIFNSKTGILKTDLKITRFNRTAYSLSGPLNFDGDLADYNVIVQINDKVLSVITAYCL